MTKLISRFCTVALNIAPNVALTATLASVLTVTLVACSSQKNISENRRVRKAPTQESETGLIVSGIGKNKIVELLDKNSNLKIRVVNEAHSLYEVWGSDITELQNAINDPRVIIEKNHYVEIKSLQPKLKPKLKIIQDPAVTDLLPANPPSTHPIIQAIEDLQGTKLSAPARTFIEVCQLDKKSSPTILVRDNQGRDKQNAGILFNLGETLQLNAEASKPNTAAQSLSYMWLVTAPSDSTLEPLSNFEKQVEYTPDATGMHIYSIVARDDLNFCQVDAAAFYVSDNPIFKPEDTLPDLIAEQGDLSIFWHLLHVGAKAAWQFTRGEGIIVGVIDSGVDYNHPAIARNILLNTGEIPDNGIDDDNNSFVDDYVGYDFGQDDAYPFDDFGHGTHVAGIAASNVFGAARKAKILTTKFGAGLGFDMASVTGAIKYEVDRGAKILNMSFGWEEDLKIIREAMNYAEAKGVLVVAAAGNDTANNDVAPSYPNNYSNQNIIAVAATDENDELTSYSNFGIKSVHIAAPGGTAEKPIISSYKKNPRNAKFVGLAGTSMASPLIAGIAAEVWSAHPTLTNLELKKILLDTGKPSEKLAGKIQTGKVIDAMSAVTTATQMNKHLNPQIASSPEAFAPSGDVARLPSSTQH